MDDALKLLGFPRFTKEFLESKCNELKQLEDNNADPYDIILVRRQIRKLQIYFAMKEEGE